jgi:hypothetical protein
MLGFEKSKHDACVYIRREKGKLVIIGLHVDGMYIFSNSKTETQLLKDQIGKNFKINDLGNLSRS